nr:hypothetical protein [Anaerolineae bacterium]
MLTGMLWFDDDMQRKLDEKLARAAARYLSKYGHEPNLCYVHPSTLFSSPGRVAGMALKESNIVLPHHYWLMREDDVIEQPAA